MSGFAVMGNKGFHITFGNGVTVSVQFGAANYCEHYSGEIGSERGKAKWASCNAEVAAWTRKDEWYDFDDKKFGGGNPIGRVSADDLLKHMNELAALKEDTLP